MIFDTREANHHFAQTPYTPLASSQMLASLQLPAHATLFKAQGDLECLFFPASVTTLIGSVLWSPVNCEKVAAALVTELCEQFSWRGGGIPFAGGSGAGTGRMVCATDVGTLKLARRL